MGAGGEGIDGATGCVAEGAEDIFFYLVHACWLGAGGGCCAGGGVDGCGASGEDDGEEEDDGEGCEDDLELFVFVVAEGGEGEGPFSSLFLRWLLCVGGGGGVEKGG